MFSRILPITLDVMNIQPKSKPKTNFLLCGSHRMGLWGIMSAIKGALRCGGAACFHSAVSRLLCEMQAMRAKGWSENIASEETCQISSSPFDSQKSVSEWESLTGLHPGEQEEHWTRRPSFAVLPTNCVTFANLQNHSKPQCPQT